MNCPNCRTTNDLSRDRCVNTRCGLSLVASPALDEDIHTVLSWVPTLYDSSIDSDECRQARETIDSCSCSALDLAYHGRRLRINRGDLQSAIERIAVDQGDMSRSLRLLQEGPWSAPYLSPIAEGKNLQIPRELNIRPFGHVHLERVIHHGANNIILQVVDAFGNRLVIKTPNPDLTLHNTARSIKDEAGSAIFIATKFVDSDYGTIKKHAARALEIRAALLRSEFDTLRRFGSKWNVSAISLGEIHGLDWMERLPEQTTIRSWPCLVMPFYEGRTLASYPPRERLVLFRRMLPALWRALQGRLHGDLSPSNLLIYPDETRFRLIDPAPFAATLARAEADEAAAEARYEQAQRDAARLKPLIAAKTCDSLPSLPRPSASR